jgi:hypothetical protein
METTTSSPARSQQSYFKLCGRETSKGHCVFACQMVIIYIVIITCIVNLSIANGESNLWTALLSSCLGYILPAPSIKIKKVSPISGDLV